MTFPLRAAGRAGGPAGSPHPRGLGHMPGTACPQDVPWPPGQRGRSEATSCPILPSRENTQKTQARPLSEARPGARPSDIRDAPGKTLQWKILQQSLLPETPALPPPPTGTRRLAPCSPHPREGRPALLPAAIWGPLGAAAGPFHGFPPPPDGVVPGHGLHEACRRGVQGPLQASAAPHASPKERGCA